MEISGDGGGVVSHVGARLLAEVADGLGLTAALGERPAQRRCRRSAYDPGVVLRDVAVMPADGGDCLGDLAALRDQPELFGRVPPDATAWRCLDRVAGDDFGVDGLRAARALARERVFERDGLPLVEGMAVIDFDATFTISHSDKEQAAGTYKGGYGHYPLLSYLDRGDGTGEPLAGVLRPGNAGSNTVLDHQDVLTLTLDQLPVTPGQAPMLVRADSVGASHGFLAALRAENIMFSVGFPIDLRVRQAVEALPATAWVNARAQHGGRRTGAGAAELHSLEPAADGWPEGTRAIVRREPRHPGAQLSFLDADGHRITCFVTDQPDADVAGLERRHRAHARVEDRIRNAKACGLRNLPFNDFARNQVWLELVLCAQDLIAWTQRLCLHGPLAKAEPKTLRYRLLHTAGRITRHARRTVMRLQRSWPWTRELVAAFASARTLAPPARA